MNRIKREIQPRYQIARAEAAKIEQGAYPAGSVFPSITELAETWGSSKQTVHQARKILQAHGYIYGTQGRATLVMAPPYRKITLPE